MNEEEELTCFAGLAMQAIISKLPLSSVSGPKDAVAIHAKVARSAWRYAEAMLAEKAEVQRRRSDAND